MVNLTVMVTEESDEKLRGFIEGLKRDATGYIPGLDVKKDENVSGKYILEKHRGTITDDISVVRVVGEKVIIGKASWMIESMLKERKVSFKRYDGIEIENQNTPDLKIDLPEKAVLTYSP